MGIAIARRRLAVFTGAFLALTLGAAAIAQALQDAPPPLRKDVPYVPTSDAVVNAMLKLAEVRRGDVVYDLGCGDGRIVITAAKRHGVRGVGIDIDPERIAESRKNARRAGVEQRVEFRVQDLFDADIGDASVVTLYLLPDVNRRLMPKLLSDLEPGTRVVSHAFDMGDWQPERVVEVDGTRIFLWRIPARTASGEPVAARG